MRPETPETDIRFLSGGGEMGALTRVKDWSKTTLGGPENWPQSLRTTLSILLHSKFPMFLWWGPELLCFYNDAYRPSLGNHGKHPSILGQPAQEAWPEIWTIIKPLIDQVLEGGEATWSEDQLIPIFRNGRIEDVYWTFSYSPVNDESNKPAGVFVTCTETTPKVNTLKQIKEREDQLSFTINAAELATWNLNPATNRFVGNERLMEWFGIAQGGEIELPVALSRIVEKDRQGVIDAIQAALQPGSDGAYGIEYDLVNPITKVERRVLAKGKALFNEDHIAYRFSGTLQDITPQVLSRRKVEEAIEELTDSEQKFRLLADSMPQFVWTGDAEGNLNYFNRSVYNYSGLTPEQVQKEGWLQIVHPDERAKNTERWVNAVSTGNDFIFEHRFRRYDGEYRWQLSRAIPQKDANGTIQMWVGTSTDIQDQKSFAGELERQVHDRTKELEQKNKELGKMNTELQSFAYVSSHDLQEPLRKIQTFASLILEKEREGLSEKGRNYFERMQGAAKRMQTLIEDLLAYSRTNTSERIFQYTDLNEIVAEVKKDLKESLAEKQAILEYGDLGKVNIIPFQFKQLMHNLIGNSLKFSRPGMPSRIAMMCETISGSYHITISDNGIGFEPHYKERIFELFQRLHGKEEYAGTGIGLAIVKKIIENHNGTITATGELNKGARFDIYIPA